MNRKLNYFFRELCFLVFLGCIFCFIVKLLLNAEYARLEAQVIKKIERNNEVFLSLEFDDSSIESTYRHMNKLCLEISELLKKDSRDLLPIEKLKEIEQDADEFERMLNEMIPTM